MHHLPLDRSAPDLAGNFPGEPSCPSWLTCLVPKKKKLKKFRATTAVKAMARKAIGSPPPVKREENPKRARKEKYKPTISRLLLDVE